MLALLALISCQSKIETIDNLRTGIIGETTASLKYKAFAEKARQEGNESVAKLFDATSQSEKIHALNHTTVLAELGVKMDEFVPEKFETKTTLENLKAAIDGEAYEVNSMYPDFISSAKTENKEQADKSFTWAIETEKKHEKMFSKALEAMKSKMENSLPATYTVCPVCGNTFDKTQQDLNCAFCQTNNAFYIHFK